MWAKEVTEHPSIQVQTQAPAWLRTCRPPAWPGGVAPLQEALSAPACLLPPPCPLGRKQGQGGTT